MLRKFGYFKFAINEKQNNWDEEKHGGCRENKVEWFGMRYLLSASPRLQIHPAKFDKFKDEKKQPEKLSQFHKVKTCWK